MSKRVEKALELFSSGFNCSQAVVGAFCKQFGMDEQLSMKLACGFAGGLRCGEVCPEIIEAAVLLLEEMEF